MTVRSADDSTRSSRSYAVNGGTSPPAATDGGRPVRGSIADAAAPSLGDVFKLDYGDQDSYLDAPPRGTMWYQPGGEGSTFRLMKLGQAPFRLNDLIGINRGDEVPETPAGKRLLRVAAQGAARRHRLASAQLYKVVPDEARDDYVADTRKPRGGYRVGMMYSVPRAPNTPEPPPGTAWDMMGVNTEDRSQVWALLKRIS